MTRHLHFALIAAAVALACAPIASAQQRAPQAVSQAGQTVNAAPGALIVAPAGGVLGKGRPVAEDAGLPMTGRNTTTHAKCTIGVDDTCGIPGSGGGGGGDASAANQSTQITAANLTNTLVGALANGACGTDNGTCAINDLIKRTNQRITSLIAAVGSPLQAGGSVSLTGTLPAFGSTPTFNCGTGCGGGVSQGSATSGQVGTLNMGAVTTSAPTYTTAQTSPFSLTTAGGLRTTPTTPAGVAVDLSLPSGVFGVDGTTIASLSNLFPVSSNGTVASAATDSGNPVKVGGKYNATMPTFTDGQRGDVQLNSKGAAIVVAGGYAAASNDANGITNIYLGRADFQGNTNQQLSVAGYVFNGASNWIRTRDIVGIQTNGEGTTAVANAPTTAATAAIVPVVSTAVESGHVLKASAGNLYRVSVTTGASAGFLMVFNSTTVPADGAVTPLLCRGVAANATVEVNHTAIPDRYGTGVSAAFSTTGCFTKTASATAMFEASVQ